MSTTKKKKKSNKLSPEYLKKKILTIIRNNPKKRYSPKQFRKKLKIDNTVDSIRAAMDALVKEKKILKLKDNIYKADRNVKAQKETKVSASAFKGIVDMTRRGVGYIMVDGMDEDIFVSAKDLKGALNRDEVLVELKKNQRGRKLQGKVIKVVKRNLTQVVGRFRQLRKFGIVEYNGKHGSLDVNIKPVEFGKAKDGDVVFAEITEWGTSQNKSLWGKVVKVLTQNDAHNFAMQQIIVDNGFELHFPKNVLTASKKLDVKISQNEIDKRRDMRSVLTITIDPWSAQDFDDALSIQSLENGNIEIGIHIADVSHYVEPDSAIDKEAFKRSTSVYLVDRCVPMLPEVLSNKLCSLRPDEDSLCFSAIFEFDDKGKIKSEWFGKTIIHSDRRFTYEEAQEIIEKGEGELSDELTVLDKIAKKLRKEKFKNGAIAFESEEIQFKLDEDNRPIEIFVKERKDAHLLVEDYMLLANRSVAKFMAKLAKDQKEIPFVYRVHDLPNMDKLTDFSLFAKEMGFKMKIDTPENVAKSFNALSKEARSNELLKLLEPLAIRTMAKAIYTTENIGHYGLGFEYYTHFTSPIRRYSDLLVHRILDKNLKKAYRTDKTKLELKCKHISAMEKSAMEAERESVKYKQVEFMENQVGEEFEGFISGMIDQGIFVQLSESRAEGFIRFDQMDEAYDLHSSRLYATGFRSKRKLSMGNRLIVKLVDADMELRQLDFELIKIL